MLKNHQEQLKHAADRRDVQALIDDCKLDAEGRIRYHMIQASQDIRSTVESKIDLPTLKKELANFAKDKELKVLERDFENLKSYVRTDLSLQLFTLKEDFRLQNVNTNRPELETILAEYMLGFEAKLEQRQLKYTKEMQEILMSKDETINKLQTEIERNQEKIEEVNFDLGELRTLHFQQREQQRRYEEEEQEFERVIEEKLVQDVVQPH